MRYGFPARFSVRAPALSDFGAGRADLIDSVVSDRVSASSDGSYETSPPEPGSASVPNGVRATTSGLADEVDSECGFLKGCISDFQFPQGVRQDDIPPVR